MIFVKHYFYTYFSKRRISEAEDALPKWVIEEEALSSLDASDGGTSTRVCHTDQRHLIAYQMSRPVARCIPNIDFNI